MEMDILSVCDCYFQENVLVKKLKLKKEDQKYNSTEDDGCGETSTQIMVSSNLLYLFFLLLTIIFIV